MSFGVSKVVAAVINKFAEKYLETVDGTQLQLDFLKHKGQIQNVYLKSSALDDLKLPIQIKTGHVGSLLIDFPLTNIWSGKWRIELVDISVVATPAKVAAWSREEIEAAELSAKLKQIELREAITIPTDGDSSLAERLSAKVLENLDLTFRNLHIRYEDALTVRGEAFAVGLAFEEIKLHSAFIDDVLYQGLEGICRKIGGIEKLSVYLETNLSHTNLYSNNTNREKVLEEMRRWHCKKEGESQCVLGPVSCTTDVTLCISPWKNDWKQPKTVVDLVITNLKIGLSKSQFRTSYLLAQTFDVWSKGAPYRKFHPGISEYKGNARKWWKFAINCVLDDVHRKNVVWSWNEHFARNMRYRKAYRAAYEKKLRGTKLSEAERQEMKEAEKFLSVGNMLRERKLAQDTLEREKKSKAQQSSGWSLTSWLFGKKDTTMDSPTDSESAVSQIQMALRSEEEQQALRDALDLAGETQSQYPKKFQAFTAKFCIQHVDFKLKDDERNSNVFHMVVDAMEFGFAKRPAADSIRLTASLTNFAVTNGQQDGKLQVLVERHIGTSEGLLLYADFETNPDEDGVSCDQKLTLKALPLDVYYSWSVLDQVKSIFKPPNADEFSQLKAQAELAVGAVQQSLAALEYTKKEKAMKILLDVNMHGSYVILPESGTYIDGCSCIVANLGTLKVKSLENPAWQKGYHRRADIKDFELEAAKLIQMSYDIYQLDIENVQVVSVMENETWLEQLEDEASCILGKTSLRIEAKITALKDVRAPKVILDGTLPSLNLALVDRRVSDALKIMKTMSPPMTEKERKRMRKVEKRKRKKRAKEKAKEGETPVEEQRMLEGSFKLNSLTVNLSQFAGFGTRPFATLKVVDVGLQVRMLEDEQRFGFSVREILLQDDTDIDTYYKTILTQLGGERTLDLKVSMFTLRDEELNDETKYQMSVELVGASLQFVFLNRFVQDLVAYGSRLSVDKAAVIGASQVAADQALYNLKELYQNQTRIKLNISLNAPVILLPKGSTERHVIKVDLGKLKVQNEFEAGAEISTFGDKSLFDNMKVELQECKLLLGLCEADGSSRIRSECYLLEPISFHVGVRRSLSRWNKVGPEIAVNAKLTKISVLLCEADLPHLQNILDSNFKENGQIEQFDERTSMMDEASSMVSDWSTASELTAASLDLERVKIKASIILEGAKVELFTGCTALTQGLARRNLELSYVMLQVLDLTADFEMCNDTSFSFNAELKGITMRDTRSAQTIKHRNLIEPRTAKEGHNPAMMVVSGSKSKTGDFNVSVVFAGVQILVCVPFYLRLLPFFTNPDAETKPAAPVQSAPTRELNFETFYTEPIVNTMQIFVTMNNIEMLLVESLSEENAYAIVAKVRADMQYLKSGLLTNLDLGIGKLEMFSCRIDQLKQTALRGAILAPVKGHVHLENFGTQNLTEVDCKLEPISGSVLRVNIAPGTVDLFQRAISTLLKGHEQEEEEEKPWQDLSGLFNAAPAVQEELHNFIPLDVAREVGEEYAGTSPSEEELEFSAPTEVLKLHRFKIEINVEAGLTLGPLVRVKIGVEESQIVDWSNKLSAELSLTLQVLYYSDRSSWMIFALEPLPSLTDHMVIERPYRFTVLAKKNQIGDKAISPATGEMVQLPEWTYTIKSEEPMELTATKSLLDVVATLGKAFGEKQKQQLTVAEHWWGLKVVNDLHVDVTVDVNESGFFDGDNPEASRILMKPRSEKSLSIKSKSSGELQVQIAQTVHKINTHHDALRNLRFSDEDDGLVAVEVKKSEGQTVVGFHSKMQIMNHTKRSVYVYTADKSDRVLQPVGTIRRCGVFRMPANLLASGSVYFVPEGDYHHTHFSWKAQVSTPSPAPVTLECRAKKDKDPFYFKVITEHKIVPSLNAGDEKLTSTTLHLCPTLMLVNQLPFDFSVRLIGSNKEFTAKPGESVALENLSAPNQMSVMIKYMDNGYICQKASSALLGPGDSDATWEFEADPPMLPRLVLYSITKTQENTPHAFLHAKFWLMNSTGLLLLCKNEAGDETEVPQDQVVLFHSKGSRAGFRLGYRKGWSESVRLDAPGSEIVFRIKSTDATYMVAGSISLASAGMTFKVVLTPGIQFANNTRFPLMYEFLEDTPLGSPMDDKFLGPKLTKGVWPRDPEKTKVVFRQHGCLDATGALPLVPRSGVLVKMKGPIGAIFVEYLSTTSTTSLCISEYSPGLAPWKIVNLSGESLVYGQKTGVMHILGPSQKALFTWEDPLSDCVLVFGSECQIVEAVLEKANPSELIIAPGSPPRCVYWQTFILEQQPTVVIAEELELLAAIDQSDRFGKPQMCVRLQLEGVGLSIVDEERRKEIAYASVFRPTTWQYKSHNGIFKNFSDADSKKLETLHFLKKTVSDVALDKFGTTKVYFDRMVLDGERPIRRAFDCGLSAEVTFTENGFRQCSFSAAAVQLDNHMEGCLYPVVFAPAPPRKTVVTTSSTRPFLYLVYIDRVHEERPPSDIIMKAVLQNAVLNAELPLVIGLINFMYPQMEPERKRESQRVAGIQRDITFPEVLQPSRTGQRTFVRLVDVSPASVQLSFSLSNVQDEIPEFLAFVLRTVNVGASFSDANLSFDAFILRNGYQSTEQLVQALRTYYTTQALAQVYKIALGLDIFGNPLKFVSGIGTGVGSFVSEPFEGAMQGADEFAEGLFIGTQRLFQGTVGGVAGALGTIAGALATGATTMTFDRQHQTERREQKIARGKAQTGLPVVAGNVSNFVDNVASGVAGVFLQPVQGAKQEGASGFFKGVGKGLMGLVARPVAAVADLAADTFKTVESAAGSRTQLERRRLTRFIPPQGVEPYVRWKAEGAMMLKSIGTLPDEVYVADGVDHRKNTLLITNRRVMLLKKSLVQDHEVIWSRYIDGSKVDVVGTSLVLKFKDHVETVYCKSEEMAKWLKDNVNAAKSM